MNPIFTNPALNPAYHHVYFPHHNPTLHMPRTNPVTKNTALINVEVGNAPRPAAQSVAQPGMTQTINITTKQTGDRAQQSIQVGKSNALVPAHAPGSVTERPVEVREVVRYVCPDHTDELRSISSDVNSAQLGAWVSVVFVVVLIIGLILKWMD